MIENPLPLISYAMSASITRIWNSVVACFKLQDLEYAKFRYREKLIVVNGFQVFTFLKTLLIKEKVDI